MCLGGKIADKKKKQQQQVVDACGYADVRRKASFYYPKNSIYL